MKTEDDTEASLRDPLRAAIDRFKSYVAAGKLEDPGSDGACDGELVGGVHVPEPDGPADQVVGEHCAAEPGGVGAEPARRAVLKPGALFGEMAVFDRSERSTDAISNGRHVVGDRYRGA